MIIRFVYLFCMAVAVFSGIKSLIAPFPSERQDRFSIAIKFLIIGGILLIASLYFTQHPEILAEYPYLQSLFAM